jgi:hypothetical protein
VGLAAAVLPSALPHHRALVLPCNRRRQDHCGTRCIIVTSDVQPLGVALSRTCW